MQRRFSLVAKAGLALLACAPLGAQLTTVRVAQGLDDPLYVTGAPGDFERLYIVEQPGVIKVLKDGQVSVFMNIEGKVLDNASERGLLGMAFHPDYETNGFFYVSYTGSGGSSFIERYSALDADTGDATSGVTILGPVSQPQANHNGGGIQFGPDGMLYLGLGDGGNFNDQGSGHVSGGNAQSLSNLLGKMLRLDVDIAFPHAPSDNPFFGGANTTDDLIWSYGLRNPWRFSFDRLTGDMYIGDVGQDAREEVNFEPPGMGGRNYGWRCMEGFQCTGLSGCTCNAPSLTLPFQTYNHPGGGICSVTGGYVYRGCAIPTLAGTYFYADVCSGQIWSLEYDGVTVSNFTDRTNELDPPVGNINSIVSFGEDSMGEMYICDLGGEVYKILPVGGADCNANFIEDGCEISFGLTADTNGNGVPDECECPPALTYCVAKINSQFCLPAISFTGAASASGSAFTIDADMILNGKNGLLFYGFGQNNAPFQGGTLCVQPPLRRTTIQNSGGTPPPSNDCSGTFTFDMDALIQSGTDPFLTGGSTVNAQYWYRDPSDGFGVGLTDALEFVICNL